MKISLFSLPEIKLGKVNVKDSRLDEVDKITKAKKKTYVQVDLVGEDGLYESDTVVTLKDFRADLILKDLEFIETRLSRISEPAEKAIAEKIKAALEKEEFASAAALDDAEKKAIASYSLATLKPVVIAEKDDLENTDKLYFRAVAEGGFISFFTTGEKETRAWLIKKGVSAWEAAGAIHSDIQKGFIRAEIISFNDFIQLGGENAVKQAGKMRLEPKEYIMQDTDLVNFRFNK
ncbi:MAG: DUF933 domain-containing protein [Candidatus Omnitrophica bacterium]|nr:DUF933 domain-containing protein [Candidatus Omnitrophota bacterium]MDD5652577.1 DUF933 domain-containing protein [Candidatus Omnitrophota bacterium]